jgi:hypothetical protein
MAGRRYWLPRCGAMTRKGTPCKRKPVLNPDGSIRNGRCLNHGGASTGPKKHYDRCTAGRIALYERRRAVGLFCIVREPKNAPAIKFAPWSWQESPKQRKARIAAELKARFPERDWD